ncbi:MAG TPA: GNAT family N-acetyltransferase [Gaiellaceae bacterium]|nr:GNAT family N-acetyltransferase [Gaiellaceae bacterium]
MSERPFTAADFGAFAGLLNALEHALTGHLGLVDAASVEGWLQRSDLARDTLLIEENGAALAGVFVEARSPRGVFAGVVHPEERGRGLGGRLIEFGERRLVEVGAEKAHAWAFGQDAAAQDLFAARGYREVRRFWDMAIELGDEPPAPAGVEVETFAGSDEAARAFHQALDEAFADHWEHHSSPFEQWWDEKRAAPDYDPTLWFLVRDGDEVAAVVRNDPERMGGGYVGALGVRRPWRGRGYGRALLLHSFREFHRRGLRRVSLGVDAANPTGATRLYESVGMAVETENVVFEKELP